MPHIIIDHSPNLSDAASGLCDALRRAAIATEAFPTAGIRVRAFAPHAMSMADGDDKHGYVDVTVRVREGRPEAQRIAVAEAIYAAAEAHLAEAMATRSVALSVELREMADKTTLKGGTVRDHL